MSEIISNEQLAHDLAIAVVSAQLAHESNVSASISVISKYEYAYSKLLDLLNRTR